MTFVIAENSTADRGNSDPRVFRVTFQIFIV